MKRKGIIEEEKSVKKVSPEDASAGALKIKNCGREKKVNDKVRDSVVKGQNMIFKKPPLDSVQEGQKQEREGGHSSHR